MDNSEQNKQVLNTRSLILLATNRIYYEEVVETLLRKCHVVKKYKDDKGQTPFDLL